MSNISIRKPNTIVVNSVILAIFMCLTGVVSVVNTVVYIPGISVLIAVILLIVSIFINRVVHVNKINLLYYFIIILLFIISLAFFWNTCLNYFLHFIFFGTTALILVSTKYDVKLVVNFSVLLNAIYVCAYFFNIKESYMMSSNWDEDQMGIAYSFLPGVLWPFVLFVFPHLCLYKKIIYKIINSLVFLSCLYIILYDTMTRGAIISVLIGIISLVLLKINSNKRKKIYILLVIGLSFLIIYINTIWDQLMLLFSNSSIVALVKLSSLSDGGDLTTGRTELYNSAIDLFVQYPLFGSGIGHYEFYNGIYSHQFFLQLLCEFGLLGTILFLIPIFKSIKLAFISNFSEEILLVLVLFSNVFVMLLVSNVHWLQPNFWILFFFYFSLPRHTTRFNCKAY